MDIRIATEIEYAQLVKLDHHISEEILARKIEQGEVIVAGDSPDGDFEFFVKGYNEWTFSQLALRCLSAS